MAKQTKTAAKRKPAAKKVTKESTNLDEVVALLSAIDGKLELISDYVLENRQPVEERIESSRIPPTTFENVGTLKDTPAGVEKRESTLSPTQTTNDKIAIENPVLINQNGDKVTTEELSFEAVKAEAQLLCNIEKETTKAGFHKAKAIISSFGVVKLEDLAPIKRADIVSKFREAVNSWK